jgi:tellurite resistance protein
MTTDLEHFRNLVSLSAADGVIEESERVALSKIAFDKGIPFDRMNIMLSKASEYQFLIPQNTIDREKQLQEMIQFAKIDGNFCKAELDLITTVAEKLGFTNAELTQFLNKA